MSAVALVFLLCYLAVFGIVYHQDEGTAAHLFQLLMAGQIPVIALFAIRWFPKDPKSAAVVLILQIIAFGLAFLPVYILGL